MFQIILDFTLVGFAAWAILTSVFWIRNKIKGAK